ncbi:MAG: FAD-dependent oxidoreductase [Candidatus Brocadiia bacterium]
MRTWQADVTVVGGGMAGIASAIAAARAGADTILIERGGWLGGIGITGATGLHTFYNVYGAEEDAPRRKLVGGIPQDLVDRVRDLGGGVGHVPMERGADFVSMLTPVEPEAFKLAAVQLCREAGVRLLLHTTFIDATAADGEVRSIEVWSKAGRGKVEARVFIDASGDGDLAAAAGAEHITYAPGDEGAYAAGFTFRLCNVDLHALEAHLLREDLLTQSAHAVKPGMTEPDPVRVGIDMRRLREGGAEEAPGYFLSSSLRPQELTYCNCINFSGLDPLNPEDLTEAEVALRGRMFGVADFFRQTFDGCEGCYPAGPAPAVGPRRARAFRCDYELSQDDVTSGARFDDEIGQFGFIDNGNFVVADASSYGIPYRSLRPLAMDNLLIAGRMMTVELVAHNSTRNTTCCMVCGQAAGTAAALAAQQECSVRHVDVGRLRELLRAEGALLQPREV